jgi:hypothetical protein
MATMPAGTTHPEDETSEVVGTRPADASGAGDDRPADEIASDFQLPCEDHRERSLPVRQGDLTRMLLAEPGLSEADRLHLEAFGKILGATFHSEFFDRLRELKELYAPLDPDADYINLGAHTHCRTERSDEEFLYPFEATLDQANYRRLDIEVIKQAISAPNEMGLTYTPDFSLFEHLRVYVRGYTRITRKCRSFTTRFKKRTVALDAYQRLVIALKFKSDPKLAPEVRSDVLYLRMFKDVPHVDMEMHLPEQGTKVRMRWIDKAQVASPLVMGLPTLFLKLVGGLGSLGSLGLLGLIVAPVTAGVNSFFGFHRAKQKHLYAMIHKLYYMSLANNASVLTRVIDVAEDEEYKEAMLAYYFLWRGQASGEPWTVSRLDRRIEQYLREKTGIEINFEVGDALTKLYRLDLAVRDADGRLHATPLDRALEVLDRHWDDTFRYANPEGRSRRPPGLERC